MKKLRFHSERWSQFRQSARDVAAGVGGVPDFSLKLPSRVKPLRAECKNVRDSEKAYREHGEIVAYKVEIQRTRAARSAPAGRSYSAQLEQSQIGVRLDGYAAIIESVVQA